MDKATAQRLTKVIMPALDAALKAEGFRAEYGGGKFEPDADVFHPKITLIGIATDTDKIEFERYRHLFGLAETDRGRELTANRETWRLVTLDMKRRKYPIVCERVSDGKRRWFTEIVLDQLKAKSNGGASNGKGKR